MAQVGTLLRRLACLRKDGLSSGIIATHPKTHKIDQRDSNEPLLNRFKGLPTMTQDAPPLKPEVLTNDQVQTEALARLLERVAWLMDRAFTIPGTQIRVGLDALLGLIPGGGDLLCGLVQTGVVLVAVGHFRVPKAVAARMAANVLLDIAVGTIPLVGDAFDVAFKANTRNLRLLEEVRGLQKLGKPVPSAPSVAYLLGIGAVLIGSLLLVFVGLVAVAAMVWKAFSR